LSHSYETANHESTYFQWFVWLPNVWYGSSYSSGLKIQRIAEMVAADVSDL
jgi:hypothetical protein